MAMGVNAEGGVASHNLQRKTLIFVSLVTESILLTWGVRGVSAGICLGNLLGVRKVP